MRGSIRREATRKAKGGGEGERKKEIVGRWLEHPAGGLFAVSKLLFRAAKRWRAWGKKITVVGPDK